MPDRPGPWLKSLGAQADSLRRWTWFAIFVTGVFAGASVLAVRKILPPGLAPSLWLLALASTISACWIGARAHRLALADREAASRRGMIISLMVTLAKEDDESLTRIVGRGGPAAEAAREVLAGRRQEGTLS